MASTITSSIASSGVPGPRYLAGKASKWAGERGLRFAEGFDMTRRTIKHRSRIKGWEKGKNSHIVIEERAKLVEMLGDALEMSMSVVVHFVTVQVDIRLAGRIIRIALTRPRMPSAETYSDASTHFRRSSRRRRALNGSAGFRFALYPCQSSLPWRLTVLKRLGLGSWLAFPLLTHSRAIWHGNYWILSPKSRLPSMARTLFRRWSTSSLVNLRIQNALLNMHGWAWISCGSSRRK